MITAAGVGSGIDIESILTSLNEVNNQPVEALNAKRSALDVELSAFGQAKSALNSFNTAAANLGDDSLFGAYSASSSDDDVFTVVADSSSAPSSIDIEVLALAQAHSLASEAYASRDSEVGQGTYKFSSGGNDFEIEADNQTTLTDLRDEINDSLDNTSISASIINVDGGSRLVLTANETGTEHEITTEKEVSIFVGLNGFTEVTEAQDASLIVHGFAVTSSSNTVSDAIEGLTLELSGVGSATATIARDTEALRESLSEFVSSYNSLSSTLSTLSESDLQGDRLPRDIESRMRTTFFNEFQLSTGDTVNALEMGLSFNRTGELSLDEDEFSDTLAQKGADVFTEAFTTSDTGISDLFTSLISEYTKSGGIIDARTEGVETRQTSIDDQIERLEYRLEKVSARLRAQFSTMDAVVTNLNTTSGFLNNLMSFTNQN